MIAKRKKAKGYSVLKNTNSEYLEGCPANGVVHIFSDESEKIANLESLGFVVMDAKEASVDLDHVDVEKLDNAIKANGIEVIDDLYHKVKAYLDNFIEDDILKSEEKIAMIEEGKKKSSGKIKILESYSLERQMEILVKAVSKISDDKELLAMVDFMDSALRGEE